MKRAEILKAGHFYTMADFLNRTEADMEDIFEPDLFAAILNDAYELEGTNRVDANKLKAAAPETERLIKQAEAAFKVMPETVPMLDHFTPAAWLIRNSKALDAKSTAVSATLDRAEKVFAAYNALL
jgi:hypothetical protein